jgi:RNA polymerase sigma-70 factor (ECF subfamily)
MNREATTPEPVTEEIVMVASSIEESGDVTTVGPEQIETLYLQHRRLLMYVGSRKFGIPEEDAEALIQDVFLSYMQSAPRVVKVRSWLVAAMCNASRYYWRIRGRVEPLPADYDQASDPALDGAAEKWAMKITVQQAVGYLDPRCREVLSLHHLEGHSAPDVAQILETTVRYAEKLIHNCLKRLRQIYAEMTRVRQ